MNGSERWTRRAIAGAVLLTASAALVAYPIPPQTLWGLTRDAELVVLARVEEEGEVSTESDPDSWTPARARLTVVEMLKGKANGRIEVAHHPGLMCPAPPRFVAGRTVLAFLAWDARAEAWTVPHLSYGTLYPREAELPLFRRLVARAIALQSGEKEPIRPPVDWLVEAAEHRATRWHGLYELASTLDAIHSFYDRGTDREDRRELLELQDRARIARGFTAEPSADFIFVQTLGVVGDYPDEAFDRTAMGLIEWALAEEELPYWTSDAIELLLHRVGDPQVDEQLAALGEDSWDRPAAGLREVWRRAKVELGLPDVEPLEVVDDSDDVEVRGVGASTPS